MNVTIFTSSQPRHIALVECVAAISDITYACIETTTLFPGQTDGLGAKSAVMKTYFNHVINAERKEFGHPRFLPDSIRTIVMGMGELNNIDPSWLDPALQSDVILVFGSSYIKDPLAELLISKSAINIHMGVSPYYRGSACNFWALYDGMPGLVGATIHFLGKGLDSGAILCHVLPDMQKDEMMDGFALGMRAVKSALKTVATLLKGDSWRDVEPIVQDKTLELRYSRKKDFTEEIVNEYLDRIVPASQLKRVLNNSDLPSLKMLPRLP